MLPFCFILYLSLYFPTHLTNPQLSLSTLVDSKELTILTDYDPSPYFASTLLSLAHQEGILVHAKEDC